MFRSAATHIRLIKPKSSLRALNTIPSKLSLASTSATKATTVNTTTTFIRAMSSEALKYQFVVYAPDKANALPNRLAVREKHLQNAKELKEAGVLKAGNAFLTPESIAPGVTEKEMIGSVMVFEAESLEEVRKIVENDIYYTTGVWDPERLAIYPFATRLL